MTRTCNTGNDGCTGTTNDEFDPRGHFYVVRVNAAAVGTPVTVQLYDPAWVETGDTCESARSDDQPSIPLRNNMNPYTTTDGITAVRQDAETYCTGDVLNGGTEARRSPRRTCCATPPTPTSRATARPSRPA